MKPFFFYLLEETVHFYIKIPLVVPILIFVVGLIVKLTMHKTLLFFELRFKFRDQTIKALERIYSIAFYIYTFIIVTSGLLIFIAYLGMYISDAQ